MPSITAKDLQIVLNISLASRVAIFLLQVLAGSILSDHKADAYRTKYHDALLDTPTRQELNISVQHDYLYQAIQGFTKWDAQYFLEISMDGYVSERHLAFLPLYPTCISVIKSFLFKQSYPVIQGFDHLFANAFNADFRPVTSSQIDNYIKSAFVGFAINNFIFFPTAAVFLYLLTKYVKDPGETYARRVVWLFCFNPASIFFSAVYTEAMFAALTFGAMFVIEYRAHNYSSNRQDPSVTSNPKHFEILSDLNRLTHIFIPSLALIAMSTATRSNGLITIGFLGYQVLLKYGKLMRTPTCLWSIGSRLVLFLEMLQDLLVIFMSFVVGASGYITYQIFTVIKYCSNVGTKPKQGRLHIKPEWCYDTIPHPYKSVQRKYWNVGIFEYYELKQLPNFLLAMPMTALVLLGAYRKSRERNKNSDEYTKQLVYYIHAVLLTVFCGLTINVQVTTRILASSCPVIYWICADLVTANKSKLARNMIYSYFLFYCVIGTVLHTTFYPWT